ncbi:phage tail protein [Stutzerimonas sp. NM35]
MSDQYLGEIRIVGFNFAPYGWAQCMGQVMSITQNSALYSLLGTIYGGNGLSTFALPDLQGRVPVGYGNSATGAPPYVQGQVGGVSQITQLTSNMPIHTHAITSNLTVQVDPTTVLNVEANLTEPVAGSFLALPVDSSGNAVSLFHAPDASKAQIKLASNNPTLSGNITAAVNGQSLPMSVINPYLAVNYIIAMQGQYPTRG